MLSASLLQSLRNENMIQNIDCNKPHINIYYIKTSQIMLNLNCEEM